MNTSIVLSLVLLCFLQVQLLLAQGAASGTCKVPHYKTGCYKDVRKQEALRELLFQDRCEGCPKYGGELMNWPNYGEYLKRLACRCATEAKARGYTHFGLQFYGVCYSGQNAESHYSKYGQSNECVKKDGKACDDEDTSECVGKANANYVYRV